MRTIEALMGSPAIQRIGWALLHSLWQSAAVAVVLAVTLRRLHRAPAEARYLAACVALVMMVALPAATADILSPRAGLVDALGSAPTSTARRPGAIGSVGAGSATLGPRPSPYPGWLLSSRRPRALLPALVAAWMIGIVTLSLRLLGGWLLVQRLGYRHARPVAGGAGVTLARVARALRIRRGVRLLESSLVKVPMVIGGIRPVILLPVSALTGLTPGQLEALLAHELAHIRRHDYLVNLAQSAIEILLFHHPAAWWVSRVIRAEREHCCDDLAVRACGDRLAYARALAAMEGLRGAPHLSVAASDGPLLARVRRILNLEVESMDRLPLVGPGAALLIGSVLLVAAPAQQPGPPAGATRVHAPRPEQRLRLGGNPPIRTVYVPPLRSKSFRRDVQFCLTEAIIKEIEGRTRYKVVGKLEEADTILEGTVDSIDKDLAVEDPFDHPRPPSARIQATIHWLRNPPLESEPDASPARFVERVDSNPEVDETSEPASYRACRRLARQIVQAMEASEPETRARPRGPGIDREDRRRPGGSPRLRPDGEARPHRGPADPATSRPIPGGTPRRTRVSPLTRDGDFSVETSRTDDGGSMTAIHGGVVIVSNAAQYGILEINADDAIIRRGAAPEGARGIPVGRDNEVVDSTDQPMEVYLEGGVVLRQSRQKEGKNGDRAEYRARRAYFDFRTGRLVGKD